MFQIENTLSPKQLNMKLKTECEFTYPELKNVLTLSLMADIPTCLTNPESLVKILPDPNEFTNIFMPS